MSKILIIGSSYIIKNTFRKKYLRDEIIYSNFRDLWDKRKLENFDIIILSGFHRKILYKNKVFIAKYIEEYKKFIIYLSKYCSKLYLISTFIPNKISFSRVVFFYQNLTLKLFFDKKIFILSFPKIIDQTFKKKYIYKFLKFLKIELTEQEYLINHTKNFVLKKISEPNYFFLTMPRNMFLERLLRIFDVNIK